MATKNQEADRERQAQNRQRGVLESDGAVDIPGSSTIFLHHHHDNNVHGVVRQDAGVSDMDASDEIAITNDQLATNGSMTDTPDRFLHGRGPALSCIDMSTGGPYGSHEETVRTRPGSGASCGTPELEIGVGRLQVENEDDLDENGDT